MMSRVSSKRAKGRARLVPPKGSRVGMIRDGMMKSTSWRHLFQHPLLSALVGAIVGGALALGASYYFYRESAAASRKQEAFNACQDSIPHLETLIEVAGLANAKLAPEGGAPPMSIDPDLSKAADASSSWRGSLTKWSLSTSDASRFEELVNPLLKAATDWTNAATMANPGTITVLTDDAGQRAFLESLRSQARRDAALLQQGHSQLVKFCRDERPAG